MRGLQLKLMIWALVAGLATGFSPAQLGDVEITCFLTYDQANSTNETGSAHSGELALIEAGSAATNSFLNGSISGSTNLLGSLSQPGDGVILRNGTAFSIAGATLAGVDASIIITNHSAQYSYDITFLLTYTNEVEASGSDAFAHSELTLDQDGAEIFASDVESDTVHGDQLTGIALGSSGAEVTDLGQDRLTVRVAPGSAVDVQVDWTTKLGSQAGGSFARSSCYGSILLENIADTDSDEDGHSDKQEDIAGTNPNDPNSLLRVQLDATGPALLWPSAFDRTYTIYGTTNLPAAEWIAITNVPAAPPVNVFDLQGLLPTVSNSFFHVEALRLLPQ